MILMGARHFIEMPVGTMYLRINKSEKKDLLDIIKSFVNCPEVLYKSINYIINNLFFYGDCETSVSLERSEWTGHYTEDSCLDWQFGEFETTDDGDGDLISSPDETLYLVIDEDMIPDKAMYGIRTEIILSKEDVLRNRKLFISYYERPDSTIVCNKTNPVNDNVKNILLNKYKNSEIANVYLIYNKEVNEQL